MAAKMKSWDKHRNYHNGFASIAVLGVNDVGNLIAFHSNQPFADRLPRRLGGAYKNNIPRLKFSGSVRDTLRQRQAAGYVEGRDHAGTVSLSIQTAEH